MIFLFSQYFLTFYLFFKLSFEFLANSFLGYFFTILFHNKVKDARSIPFLIMSTNLLYFVNVVFLNSQLRSEEVSFVLTVVYTLAPSPALFVRSIYEVMDPLLRSYFFPNETVPAVNTALSISWLFYLILAILLDYRQNRMVKNNVFLDASDRELEMNPEEMNCIQKENQRAAEEDSSLRIQAKRITKIFKTSNQSFYALKDVSLTLDQNESLGLLGPNGAGKSTLFNIMSTNFNPTTGTVSCNGSKLNPSHEFFNITGICAQDNILWDSLPVEVQVDIFCRMRGIPMKIQRAWFEILDMGKFRRNVPSGLSSGMQRKICFIISAVSNPKIKFLDEVTTGLDPLARKRFREIVTHQKTVYGGSSIFTTHTMSEAELMCDKIAILINGTFVVIDDVENIKKQSKGFNLTLFKNSPLDLGQDLLDQLDGVFPDIPNSKIGIREENTNRVVYEIFGVDRIPERHEALVGLMKKGVFKDFDFARKNLDDVIIALSRHQAKKTL